MGINRNVSFVVTVPDEDPGQPVIVERDVEDGDYRYWIKQDDGNLILVYQNSINDLITALTEIAGGE